MDNNRLSQGNMLQFIQATRNDLKNSFLSFLQARSIDNQLNDEDNIRFKYNGLDFVFITYTHDPFYFRIILLNLYKFDNNIHLYQVINQMNVRYKVGKCFISSASKVCCSFEQFIYSTSDSNYFFERALIILKDMATDFQNLITNNHQDD